METEYPSDSDNSSRRETRTVQCTSRWELILALSWSDSVNSYDGSMY